MRSTERPAGVRVVEVRVDRATHRQAHADLRALAAATLTAERGSPDVGGRRSPCENAGVSETPQRTEVLVVGAGPAGASAAAWAARAGRDVVLADAAVFPRDKTCGDGLTPRAVAELDLLGLGDWVREHTVNRGLRAHGFGQTLHLPWPGGSLPDHGSAVPRTELDDRIRTEAIASGASGVEGAKAVDARVENGRVTAVTFRRGDETFDIECERLVVADGVRSGLGKVLGREWHQDTVYAVAGRCYVDSAQSDDPWISSHLELRSEAGEALPGYGWIFPLGGGRVNVGIGTLATTKRPAEVAIKPLMKHYTDLRRADFGLSGEQRMPTSALLPDGRRREQRRRRQLGPHRRRRRLRQPAQRRGHRLRPRDRPARRRRPRHRPRDDVAGAAAPTTTARPSRSPAASPASSPSRGPSRRSVPSACAATGS